MDKAKLSQIIDDIISIKPMFFKAFGKSPRFSSEITPAEYFVMLHLAEKNILTMTDIGKITYISKPNVTVLINKLITKGFVDRQADLHDRRLIKISLTGEGAQFVKKKKVEFRNHIKEKLLLLSEDEIGEFSNSLQIIKNILLRITLVDN